MQIIPYYLSDAEKIYPIRLKYKIHLFCTILYYFFNGFAELDNRHVIMSCHARVQSTLHKLHSTSLLVFQSSTSSSENMEI